MNRGRAISVAAAVTGFCSKKRSALWELKEEGLWIPVKQGTAEPERFWHDAIDGTLLPGAFRVLCIDDHLAKICLIDRSRRVRIKIVAWRPNRFIG